MFLLAKGNMLARYPLTEADFNLLLGLMLSSSNVVVVLKNPEHHHVFAKGRVSDVYGVSPESLIGRDDSQWLSPECVKEIKEKERLCMSTGDSSISIDNLRTLSGRTFQLHTLRYPYRNESGQIIGMGAVSIAPGQPNPINPLAVVAEIKSASDAMREPARKEPRKVMQMERKIVPRGSSMRSLQWHKIYESGNATIDSQHQRLLEQAIDIHNAMTSDRDGSVMPQVKMLVSDICQHFKDEVKILQEADYPGTKQHELLHEQEVNAIADAIQKSDKGEISIGELVHFIVSFTLMKHLVTADMDYFSFLQQQPAEGR